VPAVPVGYDPVERWERSSGAALAPLGSYRRREPEKTLLHAAVREELEPLLAAARQNGSGRGLPAHVERELRGYLGCGILANGFARVRCPDCGFERLVAFSCKAAICPSCATRRMEDAAEHLVRDVLPAVPVRQWVLSFPRRLRFRPRGARPSRPACWTSSPGRSSPGSGGPRGGQGWPIRGPVA